MQWLEKRPSGKETATTYDVVTTKSLEVGSTEQGLMESPIEWEPK